MILTTEHSGGGHNARDERQGLRVHKVQTHVGPEVDKVPEDVSQMQQPILEHGEDSGAQGETGVSRRRDADRPVGHISLFTGAGGLDIGLEAAGFQTRVTVEVDRHCQGTLERNRAHFRDPRFPLFGDITETTPSEILEAAGFWPGEVALVAGGPPCQAYSTAGKRGSLADPRGGMFFHYAEVIRVARPRFFIMENVRGLLSAAMQHRPLHLRGEESPLLSPEEQLGSLLNNVILPTFEDDLGYEIVYGLVNALDYGAAQDRKRVIFIGSRDRELGSSRWPGRMPIEVLVPSTHNREGTEGKARWLTLRDVLEGLDEPVPEFIRYSKARAEILDKVPAGKNWRHLRDTYGEEYTRQVLGGAYGASGGRVGFWRRLSFNKWSPTLVTSPIQKGSSLCHPEETRPLSVKEYARIQGFPDQWEFTGGTAAKYKQIGNAVPIPLSTAIGCAVMRLVAAKKEPTHAAF